MMEILLKLNKPVENFKEYQIADKKLVEGKETQSKIVRKVLFQLRQKHMSHFSYACKTEGKNGISRLISTLCVNCLISIPEYSRIIDYSIIWMCIWCGLLQKLHKIKKSELLNSKVSSKL